MAGSVVSSSSSGGDTHIHDLPDVILSNVFTFVADTRSRNAMSLVCTKWLTLERLTRTTLTLRGNIRDLSFIKSFPSVTHLDLSLLSPWGHSLVDSSIDPRIITHFLAKAFPCVISLTLYVRTPSILNLLAPQWPGLRHVKLVRWHQRPTSPPGSDFVPLFQSCPLLSSLDLSHFYCWTEDLPPALQAHPSAAASLCRLDLLTHTFTDGFRSHELLAITSACPNLTQLLAACMFHPRYIDSVGDETLLALASNCPRLSLLYLANAKADRENDEAVAAEDARISRTTLEELFTRLPLLEELTLDVCHNVRDTGPALELLNSKCPLLKSLMLGQFHGICRAMDSQLDGVAVCKRLESLSINNSVDLIDSGLISISRGCPRLVKFEVQGCERITEMGMRKLASTLRWTLVDVKISGCKHLDAVCSLRALEPIRDRIQRLHIDCVWDNLELSKSAGQVVHNFDLNELDDQPSGSNQPVAAGFMNSGSKKKKCRYSTNDHHIESNGSGLGCRTWEQLRYLSLWIAVGELLGPLALVGLENCPALEEIQIKVEGDCRRRPKPSELAFGLSSLGRYPRLSKMNLDCGDVIGYALTAPAGKIDLNLWERFYLNGIGYLKLYELDYWPPRDRDVNKRSLNSPGAGLLGQCTTLRKLFIHGTAHEHFLTDLLRIPNPNLRDVQLREDYYPAPENDMCTEMRADSCTRFEDALNGRHITD